MSKGKRYNNEGQLNYKKVFAVIIAVVVIIMFIFIMTEAISKEKKETKAVDYYALYADNAWGIVDSDGNKVIEPMYQEMIIVVNNSKDVFLCTYDVNEETGEYKTKVVNKENKEIYTEYDKVEALENYDVNENVWYEKDILRVQKDGKYGIIDINGKEILATQYDNIETLKGLQNSLIVEQGGLKGLVNDSGVTIIPPEYKSIDNFGDDYQKGYIVVDENNKYGLISYSGTKILDNKYEKIEKIYGENYFVIKEKGKQKVIDTNGKKVLSEGFDEIKQIATSGVVYVKNKKYGLMSYDGQVQIKEDYNYLNEINTNIFVAESKKKYGAIDIEKNIKIPFNYVDIYYNSTAGIYIAEDSKNESSIFDTEYNLKAKGVLSELNTDKGYIKLRVDNEYKYYNFKFEEKRAEEIETNSTLFLSKKDGKYGYVNKEGNVVVDYIYDDATEQNIYGYAGVKKDGKWGSIGANGNVIIEPTYNLDSNLVIDFIGKWHLGQDINMNYYCEK